jgi:hypothetical protein
MAHRNQSESVLSAARSRLAALGEKKPRSKAAQFRSLWPEIKVALDNGHTLKAICECLEAGGLEMSIYTLGSYIARMRRSSTALLAAPAASSGPDHTIAADTIGIQDPKADASVGHQNRPDPLANLRKSEGKRPAFDYRPELADPDKLI